MSRRVKEDWSFGVPSRGSAIVRVRGIIVILRSLFFIPVGLSGVGLQFVPLGRVSRLVSRHLLGLSRVRWGKIGDLSSIVLFALFVIHVISNYRLSYGEVSIW